MDSWAEIRRLHRSEGLGIKTIARRLGVARNTVKAALASDQPPKYERRLSGSIADAFETEIGYWLTRDPLMPASVIAERVGWTRSASVFRAKVAQLRPLFAGLDPTDRTDYQPGAIVQCDLWFPKVGLPVGPGIVTTPPVLTMVSAWCGFIMALMIPSRTTGDLLAGMWRLLSTQLLAVPHALVWDHETGIGRDRLGVQAAGFAGTLGTRIVQVKKRSPEHKGVIERANGFLQTSFEPGRSFTGPDDFNAQLADWLPTANARVLRRTGRAPAELIDVDRAAMSLLPPVAPPIGWHERVRLGRDYYVRVLGNDYSVDPSVQGRLVDVKADLETVTVTCDGVEVARHDRLWTSRGQATDPAHRRRASELRADHDRIQADRARQFGAQRGHLVALRALSDYDELFNVGDLTRPDAEADEAACGLVTDRPGLVVVR